MREARRVIFHRAAVFMLFLLTATGGVLFWLYTQSSIVSKEYPNIYTKRYHELIDEFAARSPDKITSGELDGRIKAANEISNICFHLKLFGRDGTFEEMLAEHPEYKEALESGALQRYVDEPLLAQAERDALETIKTQISYLNEFNSYYSTIKNNAERMQRTSVFGDPNSFAYRNTVKTVKDFAMIDGAHGTLGDDRAITSVFDDPIADYLMLAFMTVISVLMLAERKSGLWQLVRATKRGRANLAIERVFTLFIAAFLATLFIFGSRLLISYHTYDGIKYGSRLIQSVQGYNGIPVPMTVNSFVMLYCGVKVVCTFCAGVLLFLMLSAIKNVNIAIAVTGAALALEFTLYSTVRDSSILVPFKYVNIFQLIVPRGFVVSYMNLNVLEHPLNTRAAVSMVMGVLSTAAAIGIVLVQVFKRPVGRPNPLEKLLDGIRRKTYKLVFMQETGKALFAERGILVVLALVYVFLSFGSLPRPTVSEEQMAVTAYYRKYAGSVSEETLASIDGDIEKVEEQLRNPGDSFSAMLAEKRLKGLDALRREVGDIIERNASGEYPKEIKLIPPFTYMIVFGEQSKSFETGQGLKALLCIALLTAGLYAYEKQSGMTKLLRSLHGGRTRLFLKKELITLAFSALVFIAVYLPEIRALAVNDLYGGFACFDYPMQGLELLRETHLPLSVGGLTVLFYLLRFFMLFLIGSAVGFLSGLVDRVNTAFVVSAAVFALPACIAAMGVASIFDFTPLTLLWGSGALFYNAVVPYVVHLLVLFAMAAANHAVFCCKRERRNRLSPH